MDNNLTENVLERNGCPLHYWVGGVNGAPWVIFTHGACVDHRSFDPIVAAAAQKYRVLTWDVRGHGVSQPMGEAFTVPLAVDDLMAVMDRVGAPRAAFVGHSNGTYIMQELAFRHPQRVQALVIAGGTCITWQRSPFEEWITRNSGAMMALFPYETLKKAGLPAVSARKDVQEYTYNAYSMLSRRDYLTIWNGVSRSIHAEPDYRITQPLLLIHGDNDRMGDTLKVAPLWAKREPNCRYEVIPKAGHFVIMDQPEIFTRLMMDFLSQWN